MTDFTPDIFLNRELSWLEFNQRVLDEALNPENPLLERLKFFTIVSSNLDEFFEVRVAGLKQQIESGNAERSADGLTPTETFNAITGRVRKMVADKYACWHGELQLQIQQIHTGPRESAALFFATEQEVAPRGKSKDVNRRFRRKDGQRPANRSGRFFRK